jgi:hypothetical protein
LGDGVVDRESYARQWRSSSTSSSSRVKQNEKMFQHQEEPIQNLMQSQHYIISMMQVTILKYAIFFFNFQTILLNCVTNDFLQQGYTPYGPSPSFSHPTTPGDPSTQRIHNS